jgi:hypothetical protein
MKAALQTFMGQRKRPSPALESALVAESVWNVSWLRWGKKRKFRHSTQNADVDLKAWLAARGFSLDPPFSKGTHGWTAMHEACALGNLRRCQQLLHECGLQIITMQDAHGFTPMRQACLHGHVHICQWLHEHGAHDDLFRRSAREHSVSPLRLAVVKGHVDVCQWIIKSGAFSGLPATQDPFHGVADMQASLTTWTRTKLQEHAAFMQFLTWSSSRRKLGGWAKTHHTIAQFADVPCGSEFQGLQAFLVFVTQVALVSE